jgi:hypothetical protein
VIRLAFSYAYIMRTVRGQRIERITVKYVVNLVDRLCDCKDFYEYQGPCTHAIAAMRRQGNDPLALFLNQYTTDYFRRTYSHPAVPVSINDLQSD